MNIRKNQRNKMLIGYYKLSVLLTYIGVASGVLGIFFAINHMTTQALICLMFAGVCDGFDGKVARACKREKEEKEFGIQIDSLADTVSFVVLPTIILYGFGLTEFYHIILYILYILAGIIRLGYFNVKAMESKEEKMSYYTGLPVTSSAIIFPVIYILKYFMPIPKFQVIYTMVMVFTALLFVLNFKLKKPKSVWSYIFFIGAIIMAIVLYLFALKRGIRIWKYI